MRRLTEENQAYNIRQYVEQKRHNTPWKDVDGSRYIEDVEYLLDYIKDLSDEIDEIEDTRYNSGHDQGYEDGEQDGYNEGYDDGYKIGFLEGEIHVRSMTIEQLERSLSKSEQEVTSEKLRREEKRQ